MQRLMASAIAIAMATGAASALELVPIADYRTGITDEGAAEIVAYLPESNLFYVVNGADATVDVLRLDADQLSKVDAWDMTEFGARANSVATGGGYIAVAVEGKTKTERGTLLLYDTTGELLRTASTGVLPDAVTFSPDGRFVVVANEGEPSDDYSVDPEGSVSIVRVPSLAVSEVAFGDIDPDALDMSVHRPSPEGTSLAQDLEPEYAAISPDSATAYVTLQENNAVAIIDIASATVTSIIGLGYQDFSGIPVDVSDRDGRIHLTNWPVRSMMQPDTIATYQWRGQTYFVTANEGDARDYDGYSEEARVSDLRLDPVLYDSETLQRDENLGRLKVTTARGDADGDGDYDTLYGFGGRSFTIWDASGNRVYDPGSRIERQLAAGHPEIFNSEGTPETADSRSDDKGIEPEGLAIGTMYGRTYAFIGLERASGIAVFDITSPRAVRWVGYYPPRYATAGEDGPPLAPEGLAFIPAARSPTGDHMLAVAYEVSGSVVLYRLE